MATTVSLIATYIEYTNKIMAPFRQSYPTGSNQSQYSCDRSTKSINDVDQSKKLLDDSRNGGKSNTMRLIEKQKTLLRQYPNSVTLAELERLEKAASKGRDDSGDGITPTRVSPKATSFFEKTVDNLQVQSPESLNEKDYDVRGLKCTTKDLETEKRYLTESSKSLPGQSSVQETLLEERARYKKELEQCQETILSNTLDLIQQEKKLLEHLPSNLTSIELENLERRTKDNEIPATVAFTTATSYLDYIVTKFHSNHDTVVKRMSEEARVLKEKVEIYDSKDTSSPRNGDVGGDFVKNMQLVEDCLTSIEKKHPQIFNELVHERYQKRPVVDTLLPKLRAIQSYMETLQKARSGSPTYSERETSMKSRIAVFDQRLDDNRARYLETKIATLEKTNERLRAMLHEEETQSGKLRARLHEEEAQCENLRARLDENETQRARLDEHEAQREVDRLALLESQQTVLHRDADIRKLKEQCETLSSQLSVMELDGHTELESIVALHNEERTVLENEILSLTNQLKAEKSLSAIQGAALEDAKLVVEEQSVARAKLAERIDTLEDEIRRADLAKAEMETVEEESTPNVITVEELEAATNAWKVEREQMESDHDRKVRNLTSLVEEVERQRDRLKAERDELRMSRSGRHWVDQVQEIEAERDRLVGDMRMSLEEIEAERDGLKRELYILRSGQTDTTREQDGVVENRTITQKVVADDLRSILSKDSQDLLPTGSDLDGVDEKQMQMIHGIAEKAVTQAGLIARLQEENEIKDVKLQNLQDTIDRLMEEKEETGGRFSVWRKTLGTMSKKDSNKVQRADSDVVLEDEEREGR